MVGAVWRSSMTELYRLMIRHTPARRSDCPAQFRGRALDDFGDGAAGEFEVGEAEQGKDDACNGYEDDEPHVELA